MYYNSYKPNDFDQRTWKSYSWDILDSLHNKHLISDPKQKNTKSISISPIALEKGKKFFEDHFVIKNVSKVT